MHVLPVTVERLSDSGACSVTIEGLVEHEVGERGLLAPALLVARPALTGFVPLYLSDCQHYLVRVNPIGASPQAVVERRVDARRSFGTS
jgi:hypothetical protein